jgi:hypothetical protein
VLVEFEKGYGVAERGRIVEGACGESGREVVSPFELVAVSSTASEAEIAAALTALTSGDHALEVDSGGAHGPEYIACGAIVPEDGR